MKTIKILWTGCANCKVLESNVKTVLQELWIEASVEKVEDIPSIMAYWVMWTPWLVIDEKVISSWKVLSTWELKEILSGNSNQENNWNSWCCCNCGN